MLDKRVIVLYDITDSKRRRKINKLLESYGVRIQRSAFECSLSKTAAAGMFEKLKKHMDEKEDKLKVVVMNSYDTVYSLGIYPQTESDEYVVI